MLSFSKSLSLWTLSILSLCLAGCSNTDTQNTPLETKTGAAMGTMHIEAQRMIHADLPDLKKSSDFIGVVKPLVAFSDRKHDNRYMPDGSLSDFSTRTEVQVIKVFKGDIKPGTVIEMLEPISIIKNGQENVKITLDQYIELPSDTPSLVFLEKNTFGQLAIGNAQDSVYSPKKDKDKKSKNFTDPIRSEIYKGLIEENMLED